MRPSAPILAAIVSLGMMLTGFAPQPPQPVDDPEALLNLDADAHAVEELVVRPPGPAWWTVSSGGRNVYILGILTAYPTAEKWNQTGLDRRLDKSDRVLTQPIISNPSSARLQGTAAKALPPSLAAQISAAATRHGAPPSRYLDRSAIEAGALLLLDFEKSLGAERQVIAAAVSERAKAKGRKVVSSGVILTANYLADVENAPVETQKACLDAAIDEVDHGAAPLRAAFEGWSRGDVRAALGAPRGMELCQFSIPGQANMRRKSNEIQATAVAKFLQQDVPRGVVDGQKSNGDTARVDAIALINLRSLLAVGGVLDQLRAKGFDIDAPQF
ncbi:TraB/GumN family protein [soil metagenome]